MFGLFSKYVTADELVVRLRQPFAEVCGIVASIDGPFVKIYEAGVFVASVATVKILASRKDRPDRFADEFNRMWVREVIGCYRVNGVAPSCDVAITRLQETFPVYRDLLFKVVDAAPGEKKHNAAVQLMWELFTNCTGRSQPEREGGFITLVAVSGELVRISADVQKAVGK